MAGRVLARKWRLFGCELNTFGSQREVAGTSDNSRAARTNNLQEEQIETTTPASGTITTVAGFATLELERTNEQTNADRVHNLLARRSLNPSVSDYNNEFSSGDRTRSTRSHSFGSLVSSQIAHDYYQSSALVLLLLLFCFN